MIIEMITNGEDILYEDDNIICFNTPNSFGMTEVTKNKIQEYINNAISQETDCIQNLLFNIEWQILYWSNHYTKDEADEFLKQHGCDKFNWN